MPRVWEGTTTTRAQLGGRRVQRTQGKKGGVVSVQVITPTPNASNGLAVATLTPVWWSLQQEQAQQQSAPTGGG